MTSRGDEGWAPAPSERDRSVKRWTNTRSSRSRPASTSSSIVRSQRVSPPSSSITPTAYPLGPLAMRAGRPAGGGRRWGAAAAARSRRPTTGRGVRAAGAGGVRPRRRGPGAPPPAGGPGGGAPGRPVGSAAPLLGGEAVRAVLVRPLAEAALGLLDVAARLLEQLVDHLLVGRHLLAQPVVDRAVGRFDDLTVLVALRLAAVLFAHGRRLPRGGAPTHLRPRRPPGWAGRDREAPDRR